MSGAQEARDKNSYRQMKSTCNVLEQNQKMKGVPLGVDQGLKHTSSFHAKQTQPKVGISLGHVKAKHFNKQLEESFSI